MCTKIHNKEKGWKEKKWEKPGKRLQELRKQHYKTQAQFAEALDVSLDAVRSWEQGYQPPETANLFKIVEKLDCDLDYLTGRIDCTRHDIQFIHDKTGLSEGAIRKLQEFITPPDFTETETTFKEMGLPEKKIKSLTHRERDKWDLSIRRKYLDIISLFLEDVFSDYLLYLVTKRILDYDPQRKPSTYKELVQDDLLIETDDTVFHVTKRNMLDSLIQSEVARMIPDLARTYHSNESVK